MYELKFCGKELISNVVWNTESIVENIKCLDITCNSTVRTEFIRFKIYTEPYFSKISSGCMAFYLV